MSIRSYLELFPQAEEFEIKRLVDLLGATADRSEILKNAIDRRINPTDLADEIENRNRTERGHLEQPYPDPQGRPNFWRRIASNIQVPSLPQNWWMWLVAAVAIVLAIQGAQGGFSLPSFGEVKVPNTPDFKVEITLATLVLFAINLWGFIEAYNRKERMMMDWWISPVIVLVLVKRPVLGHDWFLILTTASFVGLFVAVLLNESEEQPGWFSSIDLTPPMNVAGLLLILHYAKWETLPYPGYIPVWILWAILVICVAKELLRTSPGLSLFALVTGIASAFTLNAWVIAASLTAAIIGVHFAAKRGWVNTTKHRDQIPIFAGTGRELDLLVPWDVILTQTYVFAFISFALYNGNFVVILLTGGK